jgi:hypothetical protein
MRILHLLEKISIPRHVSTKIYDIISTFCKSHPSSQYIQFGSSLGDELLKFVSTEMPEIGLKGIDYQHRHEMYNIQMFEALPKILNQIVQKADSSQ